uniref:uncharacterized protein LOC105353378 n=1 Tax=Fragaria vesca subsp. vesca TaxID=101020 RepID=UPI0005CA3958|nr:PREDICTED: uncharacterized protein LOC105353378 [Fragaria vesca subsp. vesca]
MGKIRRPQVASKPPKDSWEEQLYLSVGKELWKMLTDSNNKCVYLFPNVARWNDSAAKEAFDDAKCRFLAKIKKAPCDVPSPDPEAYIDEIDWSDDAIPELDESIEWGSEGEFGLEGFEVIDPSFCVGWGPDEWYETKKEEEVKDSDKVRKEWEAYWEAKAAKAVGGGGWGKSGGRNSSSRCCTPRCGDGYSFGQRKVYREKIMKT